MAFDQSTRNFLQRTVTKCREILAGRWQAPTEGEFFRQFQEIYGIAPDGATAPMEVLAHLGDEDRETARVLRDIIDHYAAGLKASGKAEKEARREAVMRVAREQAFTVLNRLAALRMAEERGIVLECVRKGTQSEGFQLFLQSAGNAYGSTSAAYRAYLQVIFDELARDLGVLFNRFDKSSLLFPRHEALEALLKELSGIGEANRNASYTPEQVASFWGEDETIGWIYQYYNDPAERKKMREESAAPRNSRELAVRNQFFTPRYVVEFLTDNTLGRIWYEMTKGETHLAKQCRYLVRRPTEIFLGEGEVAPETPEQEGLSQTELLKQPVHIPHRPLKDPREIRLLDPACGSMHFGLYAFDIFEAIYEEAWDKGFCPALQEAYLSKEEFLKDVPRLIIENNLHGIDIDPRATQIAALSLWLRAQKAWQEQKVPADERPRVRRSNIVCAEPMPGSPAMLDEFVATLKPDLLGELVKTVFDKMQLAGEAGSLLKIEEEIRTAIDTARKEWLKQQDDLLTRKDGSQEEFFDTAEQQVIDALRAYAEQADADSYQRRLFADDAARGFAFIDLCRKRYDAVVMNPPFGSLPKKKKLESCLPAASAGNLYGAFFIRTSEMLSDGGSVGCITDRTFLLLPTYQDYRDSLRRIGLRVLADLGWEVLDGAQVATAAYVVHSHSIPDAWFVDARNSSTKEEVVYASCSTGEGATVIPNSVFETIPTHPIAHWAPALLRDAFKLHQSFEPEFGIVRKGLSPGDSDRFVNVWWEIPQVEYGLGRRWAPYANGGPFSPFYRATKEVVEWRSEGKVIRSYTFSDGRPRYVIRSADLYGSAGLTFGKRGELLNVQILPAGQVLSNEGYLILPIDVRRDSWIFLAFFNSPIARYLVNMVCGLHKEVGAIKVAPIAERLTSVQRDDLTSQVRAIYDACRELGNEETNPEFRLLPLRVGSTLSDCLEANFSQLKSLRTGIQQGEISLSREIAGRFGVQEAELKQIAEEQEEFNKPGALSKASEDLEMVGSIVSWIFGTAFGRWDIRYATGERQPPELPDPFDPLPVCPPGMLQNAEGLPAEPKDVPADYPLRISWPGILVDDENHPEDIVARVREAIELIWKDRAEAIEQEACGILGVKTLRDYFRRPAAFFADHLKRYSKSRRQAPIYWPLSTKSGSYTLWLYYHRLTPDTLYKCIQQFVEPKMKDVEQTILRFRTMLTANEGGSKERKHLEEAESLLDELKELHDELSLWAPKWKPNLNDGVLITACPLWKLFRLPKWRKDLETCWKELERGAYDWAHLAYTLSPNRVREKCKTDRSIAIAHGLEDLCQAQAPAPKAKRAKKQKQPSSDDALL